jgi:rhamnulokinase
VSVLAFDLGAGSGRLIAGRLDGGRLALQEIHRFPNDPVQVGDRLHWDILRLYHEMKQGILKAKHQLGGITSIGIDSWAVDFGLIGRNGELLGNPYHYRDHHTDGMMEEVFAVIPKEVIFRRSGIQFLQFNTIYQLAALKKAGSPLLEQAETLLMIPDLLRYFLTGERVGEFTNATTTQLFHPLTCEYDSELLGKLGIPRSLFPDVVRAGTRVGELLPQVCRELGVPAVPVIAVAEHDTGSAVAAIPSRQRDFAYLICGTWSLMGTEVDEPMLSEEALALNFTNEGGAYGTYRLLKNIMGLWILEECRRTWLKEGMNLTYEAMLEEAQRAPAFQSWIDPDAAVFLNPSHMPNAIRTYCRETGQAEPEGVGPILRCVLESLALKYRYVFEGIERLTGKRFSGLHMAGGGIRNRLLCRFTADALGKPVWAGPAESSAIGNVIVQLITHGQIRDIWQAREIVGDSFSIVQYMPEGHDQWDEAYRDYVERLL